MKYILCAAVISVLFSNSVSATGTGFYTSLKAGVSDTKMKSNEVHYYSKGNPNPENNGSEDYHQDNESKSIYPNISVAIGFDFSQISDVNVRTELEYTYKDDSTFNPVTNYEIWTDQYGTNSYPNRNARLFSNELRSQALMLNGYYDFKNTSKFTPYVGAGVGVTHIKNNYTNQEYPDYAFSKTDNHFTWSASLGIAYNITNNVALDASYRYVDAGKFAFDQDFGKYANEETSFKLSSQDYSLGIRYNF